MAVSVTYATLNQLGQMTVFSNGLPEPARYGVPLGSEYFPQAESLLVEPQEYHYQFFLRGGTNTSNPMPIDTEPMGIALNGVPLFGPLAEYGPLPGGVIQPPSGFTWDRVFAEESYGVDACGGVPNETSAYRYYSSNFLNGCWVQALINSTPYLKSTDYEGDNLRHPDGHSKIIGWAFDGYPIYGPWGYEDPYDQLSGTMRMTSSYALMTQEAYGRTYSFGQLSNGTFVQDWEYDSDSGTLDYYNGRHTKTPEYPNGTYAYFVTQDENNIPVFPYIFGMSTKQQRPVQSGHNH